MDHVKHGGLPRGGGGGATYQNAQQPEDDTDLRRGPWTVEEDFALINYIAHHGEGRWNSLARCAGLKRTGKSCRLRWLNYLRPDVRRGNITLEEQLLILELHSRWGNRWSKIAQHLPGRTDNEIKNYWRTRVQKHAKQLKCDVNSKQFKDTMRYLWMPRLMERIQAAAAATSSSATSNAAAAVHGPPNTATSADAFVSATPPEYDCGMNFTPENSAASSDSLVSPVASDINDGCYNDLHVNRDYYQANNDNINHGPLFFYGGESLANPTGYFNPGVELEQNGNQWMDGGDLSGNIWSVEDLWLFHQQFNNNINHL
ncbi:unnamed protein product [Cuscuta campestris]|uniref:Uncharacterized protein n=1 Tax=Cuscuta campestris TaxID=132261 RepID=A0A484KME2_9ASTE|nr:unnamed protein product [Cuscuta campestris]